MLAFQVRRFSSRSGNEEAILQNRDGVPFFWPNVFATSEYRNTSKAANTTVKVLRTLGMAIMWAESRGRNLDADLTHGDFLSVEDADDLVDFLGLTAAEQTRRCERVVTPNHPARIVQLEDLRPDHRDLRAERAEVDNAEIASRVRWTALYVEWHLNRRLGSLDRQRGASEALRAVGPMVLARLRQLAPRVASKSDDDVTLEGVDVAILQLAEDALRPGASNNPFTPGFIQARNYLMWRLLLDTGARRHEVREALADHVKFSIRRFEIHVSKTLARTVPIGPVTAAAFDDFIERHWAKLPKEARRRGHLFTDEKGRHLSLRAFNRVFQRLREVLPGIPNFIAPHTVRRSWNDRYSAQIDAIPEGARPTSEEEIKTRNRLQGWSGKSSMGARYAKRHIKRKADLIAQKLFDNKLK